MKKPFFSIITCTLNSDGFLLRNIKSVKDQTFDNYEHIFIDGYSSDQSTGIIESYKKESFSKKVKLIRKIPLGISDAMNQGIINSAGSYLIFLHSDDSFVDEQILQNAYDYLLKLRYPDWISGKINVVEDNGRFLGSYPSRLIYKLFPKYLLKYYNLIPHQAVFMRRTVFDRFGGFDTKLSSSMDIDLWMRIWNKTNWKYWNKVVTNFTIRKDAQSSGLKNRVENKRNILEVKRRYLNRFEFLIFKVVKRITDHYNITQR